ncbi:MAG: hypothetical protein QMC81_11575 [Thermoanaerobacterales bacterium]|nr:hypothetical protein [Thermoanaerobacterales bacterium]
MGAFTVVMLVLSALLGVGTWLYMRRVQQGERTAAAPRDRKNKAKKKQQDLKDLWDVETIREGIVCLTGGRYRAVLRLTAADFWLLSPEEQDAIEDAAAAALRSLMYPVQVYVTAQSVDLRGAVEELRQANLPPALAELARQRADYLEAMAQERSAGARQAYLVLPYDAPGVGWEAVRGEILHRVAALAGALSPARVRVEMLTSEAAADLLHHALNRFSAWRPSEAVAAGAMSLYHVSERSVA